jgi:23S rRNA maturation mini-RNase III
MADDPLLAAEEAHYAEEQRQNAEWKAWWDALTDDERASERRAMAAHSAQASYDV